MRSSPPRDEGYRRERPGTAPPTNGEVPDMLTILLIIIIILLLAGGGWGFGRRRRL
jgi:LPXTG-motif cell wall-anchored protein